MEFAVITGMSGAGKSQTIKYMEDMGFYCVDNMPPTLFSKFAQICSSSDSAITKVAFAIDTRGGVLFSELSNCIDDFEKNIGVLNLVFLDADTDTLVKRYKETRRMHPLAKNSNLIDGIEEERKMLADVKKRADFVIDTSELKPKELRDRLKDIFLDENETEAMQISVMSFGFKYGIPIDADLVFDVRFLPNPFYIPELKEKTGLDREVSDYVKNSSVTDEFLNKLIDMMDFLIPHYTEEGKSNLVVAIGCTGGKHRSVTVACELYSYLVSKGINSDINHRDINKGR